MYKLFIIAPHFPPSALPPSQRIRLMAKHCKDLGFETTIFTTQSKYREEKNDFWLSDLVGNRFRLITLKSLNQKITRKFKIGDLGLRFIPFLFFRLIKECRKEKPNFIIYPVPPWYLLIIAPVVKKITGVKYAIDFIDPWVSPETTKNKGVKKKISQFIAKTLEGWVTKHASYIYAVSEQINLDLVNRHPQLKNNVVFRAIPYGVEISDFTSTNELDIPLIKEEPTPLIFNYIGAVWTNSFPVVKELLSALKILKIDFDVQVNFIGTSYAGEGLAKPILTSFINELDLTSFVKEDANRVTYQEAVRLTKSADVLFLFGDMSKQYAASKLMGLIASQKPFFAVLHKESFPFQFLNSFNYPYLIGYSNEENDLPLDKKEEIRTTITELIRNLNTFKPIPLDDAKFLQHTAFGMTKNILTPIKEIIDYDQSLSKNK
ncbi:MAG: hypothetical protein KF732_06040 [Flavobacteriales bacterium]|nr:hypothetical protein [Flavobacteriales bacterium]